MNCIDAISENQFTLHQMYSFEKYLKNKHSDNNFIKDKIRQQLQILRDKGVIDFISRGVYRKIKG
jgi:type II restriction enzyme